MDIVEHENRIVARLRVSVALGAALGVIAGIFLGFLSRAVEPVKEYALLPERAKGGQPLPKVYWLRRYTAQTIGSPREKEREIKAGRAVALNDREIGSWLNRTFATDDVPKEDLDAVAGAAFVRIGGRAPGAEHDPVLTVTMPFKLKLFSLPVSDVNLQFVARPPGVGEGALWRYSDIFVGHARIPEFMADAIVEDVVRRYMTGNESGAKMWKALSGYRQVSIRDGRLFLAASDPNR